jgi:hypothetical protein
MESGNESAIEKVNKSEEFDCWGMPDIAEFAKELTSTEIHVIDELLTHDPKEKWSVVAERIGIGERRLRQIRQNKNVQDIVLHLRLEAMKGDLAEVYAVLSTKAISGDIAAIKLFLEHVANVDSYYTLMKKQNEDFVKHVMTALEQIPAEQRLIILKKMQDLAATFNK